MTRTLLILAAIGAGIWLSRANKKTKASEEKAMPRETVNQEETPYWAIPVKERGQDKRLESLVAKGQLKNYQYASASEESFLYLTFPDSTEIVLEAKFGPIQSIARPKEGPLSMAEYREKVPAEYRYMYQE